MSKKQVDLGTANQGDGTPIRTAFGFLNDNHTELYSLLGDGTTLSVTGDVAISSGAATIQAGSVENSMLADDAVGADELASNAVVTASIVDDNVTPAKINILDDSLAATDAHIMVGDGTDFSNVAVSGDIAITNTGAVSLATNVVDFDELANRYSELSALGSGTAFALNFNTATTFTATASGAATFTFSNAVQGQVIDLILTGDYTITFSETGSTFNKVGSTNYAGASSNLIQIVCTDDTSGSKIYHYTVNTVASSVNP